MRKDRNEIPQTEAAIGFPYTGQSRRIVKYFWYGKGHQSELYSSRNRTGESTLRYCDL